MKQPRHLRAISLLGLAAVLGSAPATLQADPNDGNVYTETDSDGIPLSISQPNQRPLTDAQLNARKEEEDRDSANKDWLMTEYEKQLQIHAQKNGEDANANLYYRLSRDPELAKLAGLPVLSATTVPGQSAASAPAVTSPATTPTGHDLFKPLITPLSAPDAAGLHGFYSSTPFLAPAPLGAVAPTKPSSSTASDYSDPADVETPGMIAANHDSSADPVIDNTMDAAQPDLSLDILPGESAEQARKEQASRGQQEQLPEAMNADELHREQTPSAPRAPGMTASTNAATVAARPPGQPLTPAQDPNAPIPASQLTPATRVQAPIASPFDILNN